ncbi:MAG TPA: carboxypeptidase regulatory-like domain-containing protein [Blastocatellia bacterium]|nr:carboxypeptidase regulatory-like domain-containing protein [Blastocatellia bacterium]
MKSCLCLLLTTFLSVATFAQTQDNSLPLRRVILYKHGVGYFERLGKVNDDQQITLSFDTTQMNDVLKSLVVLDLNQGKIGAVNFDSVKPLDKRLEEFGFVLDDTNAAGLTMLLGQLKGSRVEVKTATASSIGTVVGLEKRTKTQGQERSESQELVLIVEGELRSVPQDQIRGIKLLDTKLRGDLERYLGVLQSTVKKNARTLSISANGRGARDLFVSYVVEAPVWKTTYRVVLDEKKKPFLQGWAVVDNVQDEDWTNVSLSLVAGMPVSFIQDLQQPRYKRRPVIAPPDEMAMTPQVAEAAKKPTRANIASGLTGRGIGGVVKDFSGAVVPNAKVTIKNMYSTAEYPATTNYEGRFSVGVPAGLYQVRVESPGFKSTLVNSVSVVSGRMTQANFTLEVGQVTESVEVTTDGTEVSRIMYSTSAASIADNTSVEVNVSTQEIGELFEYKIDQPVSIKRNSSALIPIVQTSIEGETASLYNARTLKQHPMSAVYLTNTTGLTLEGGPLTVIESNTYAGEALTARIKAGEKRFITYAVDVGCRVETKTEEDSQAAYQSEIINGEFRVHYKQSKVTTYTLTNVSARPKTIYIEHPLDKSDDKEWKLVNTPAPVETTENYCRFKEVIAANATTEFKVTEELPDRDTYAVTNVTPDNIVIWVQGKYLSPPMKKALDEVIEIKAKITRLNQQIQEQQSAQRLLAQEQARMRENLKVLGKSEEEKKLLTRYVNKIAESEDQIEKVKQQEAALVEQRNAVQKQLDDKIRSLTFNHTIN